MQLAEQFEAERLRHKEQMSIALEQMKADLEAWRGSPSISERMQSFMFPTVRNAGGAGSASRARPLGGGCCC